MVIVSPGLTGTSVLSAGTSAAASGITTVLSGSHMESAVSSVMIFVVLAGSACSSAAFSNRTSPVTALIRQAFLA